MCSFRIFAENVAWDHCPEQLGQDNGYDVYPQIVRRRYLAEGLLHRSLGQRPRWVEQ